MLKIVLDERYFNIYDQIDPNAKPEIRTNYSRGSISNFHIGLAFHYRLLEEYDKGEKGDLFVKQDQQYYQYEINRLLAEKKKLKTEFDELKKRSSKGEDGRCE